MNQKNLEEIIIEVKSKVLNFLSHKPRSVKEIDGRINYYLKRYEDLEISQKDEIKADIIVQLEKSKLIDDDSYAQSFVREKVNSSKTMSRLKMREFLIKKGIDRATIDFALEGFSEDEEEEKITKDALKKVSKIKETNYYKKKQKLQSYLASKGYPHAKIYAVVDRVLDVK